MPNQPPSIAQELLSHQTFLRRLAIDLAGEDADDLVQEVWRRALEQPPRHARQLRGWLSRVARNLAANRWRGDARRAEREQRSAEQPADTEVESRFELRKELVGALDTLSRPSREAILLRYFEGLAPSEIARRRGTPVATVKTRLRRGLAQLRETLDERYGGDRATWMPAVTALAAPVGGGAAASALTIGGIAMGTAMKVSAAAVVLAAGVYMLTREPETELQRETTVRVAESDTELLGGDPATVQARTTPEHPGSEAVRRSLVSTDPSLTVASTVGTNVLRVILEGVSEEDARAATVTLKGVEEERGRSAEPWGPLGIGRALPCLGLASSFDLDPFLALVAQHQELRADELEVEVKHPQRLSERSRISLTRDAQLANGRSIYEVRVRLERPVFWPEVTVNVRDARSRAHLEDVEMRCVPSGIMGIPRRPANAKQYTRISEGLRSPIALRGGHDRDDPETRVAAVALSRQGEEDDFVEVTRMGPEFIVYARAPGYAWDSVRVDFSSGDEFELLLGRGTTLTVRLENVQLERYAALEARAELRIDQVFPNGNGGHVWFQEIDETLAASGLRLDGLKPGDYSVHVKLGDSWSRSKEPQLAREEVTLAVGEASELLLRLDDPPEQKRETAPLAGVVSFPPIGRGYEWVRLDLYEVRNAPVRMLELDEMERTDDTPHTWSFRVEDLPVGSYQFLLRPFMVSWMVDLPASGREDLQLVIPELAEVLVETFDARTGEPIPLDTIIFGLRDLLPDQIHTYQQTGVGFEDEPGRFRFGTKPGAAFIQTHDLPSDLSYGWRRMDLELVPGFQSVRLELGPRNAIRFDFRENGRSPRRGDDLWWGAIPTVRAVDHEGHVTEKGAPGIRVMEVSAPGVYEVSFEGVTAHLYQEVLPRRVTVREGETVDVIVELIRK